MVSPGNRFGDTDPECQSTNRSEDPWPVGLAPLKPWRWLNEGFWWTKQAFRQRVELGHLRWIGHVQCDCQGNVGCGSNAALLEADAGSAMTATNCSSHSQISLM